MIQFKENELVMSITSASPKEEFKNIIKALLASCRWFADRNVKVESDDINHYVVVQFIEDLTEEMLQV